MFASAFMQLQRLVPTIVGRCVTEQRAQRGLTCGPSSRLPIPPGAREEDKRQHGRMLYPANFFTQGKST